MRQLPFLAALVIGTIGGHVLAQTAPPPPNPQPAVQPAPQAAQPNSPAAGPSAAPQPQKYVVPAGTRVLLSLKSPLNTRTARPGDGVYLISTFPVVIDGHVLIPDGVYVQGVVDRVERPGKIKGRAKIGMHFTTLIFPNGQVVSIPGTVNSLPGSSGPKVKDSEGTVEQASGAGHDAGTIAKGAELGAGVGTIGGAVAGNFGAGLGYGALGGAALGAVSTLFTRGADISIPEGSAVEMVLQRPMELAPQQYAVVDDQHRQQFAPINQQEPLKVPDHRVPCSSDGVGCN